MSYPRALDEIPTSELIVEIRRRCDLADAGKCTYCEKKIAIHTCKYKGRLDDHHYYSKIN